MKRLERMGRGEILRELEEAQDRLCKLEDAARDVFSAAALLVDLHGSAEDRERMERLGRLLRKGR